MKQEYMDTFGLLYLGALLGALILAVVTTPLHGLLQATKMLALWVALPYGALRVFARLVTGSWN